MQSKKSFVHRLHGLTQIKITKVSYRNMDRLFMLRWTVVWGSKR